MLNKLNIFNNYLSVNVLFLSFIEIFCMNQPNIMLYRLKKLPYYIAYLHRIPSKLYYRPYNR